ncbi:MAG TPA: hypothetical protein VFP61_07540 [Acidimicrobiales bacterium]|nr:hypothetical protein [Acidimicrobiales bacterium]
MDAYLGYVDGRWPDYVDVAARAGGKPCFGLSVVGNPSVDHEDGGDFEPGDAGVAAIPGLVRGLHALHVARPIVYLPESWAVAGVEACSGAGLARDTYRLLTAHYGLGAHICGPSTCRCGVQADGTQWIDHGPWDESLLDDHFLDAPLSVTAPEAAAMPALARPIIAIVARPQGDGYWQVAQDGGIANFGAAPQLTADGGKLPALLAAGHLITDAAATPDGQGLWLTGSDGGVFPAGTAGYDGSWSQLASPSSNPLQA